MTYETILGPIGQCPVQAYGTIDDRWWYFRARGETWSFQISSSPFDVHKRFGYLDVSLTDAWWRDVLWEYEQGYEPTDGGPVEFGAGWMPSGDAVKFIAEAVSAYLARLDVEGIVLMEET